MGASRDGGGVGEIRVRVCGREEGEAEGTRRWRGEADVVGEVVVGGMAWPKGKREKQRVGEEKRG